jgi:hypothetical protein
MLIRNQGVRTMTLERRSHDSGPWCVGLSAYGRSMTSPPAGRYLMVVSSPANAALRRGLTWLKNTATASTIGTAGLFVAGRREIDELTVELEAPLLQRLWRRRRITQSFVTIELITSRGLSRRRYSAPILALDADDSQLRAIEMMRPPALCALTRDVESISDWITERSPSLLPTSADRISRSVSPRDFCGGIFRRLNSCYVSNVSHQDLGKNPG